MLEYKGTIINDLHKKCVFFSNVFIGIVSLVLIFIGFLIYEMLISTPESRPMPLTNPIFLLTQVFCLIFFIWMGFDYFYFLERRITKKVESSDLKLMEIELPEDWKNFKKITTSKGNYYRIYEGKKEIYRLKALNDSELFILMSLSHYYLFKMPLNQES